MNTLKRQICGYTGLGVFLSGLLILASVNCVIGSDAVIPKAKVHPTFVAPPEAPNDSVDQPRTTQELTTPQEEPASTAQPLHFDTESEEYPLGRGTPGFALLLGSAFQHTGTGWDAAPTLAARYYFPLSLAETEGPEALSPWSLEMGAVLPHQLSGSAGGSADETVGTTEYHVKINKFSSEHLALQYRWAIRWPLRMTPDFSLGLSVAQFENDYEVDTPTPGNFATSHNTALGPLARVGLPLLANDWFALRMEVGYVHYSNTVNNFGHSMDLGLSGIGVYPSIQVSLGYLHPGVEKGVYLPPSAVPLWALAAMQTEKKSPIIAPPEVLLNPRQAAVQGGLSGNVLLQYKSRSAQKVELLGDFNQWKPEPMYLDKAHVWITVKDLPAGTYHYTFLVNGRREIRDPWNPSFDPSRRPRGCSQFVVPEVMPTR